MRRLAMLLTLAGLGCDQGAMRVGGQSGGQVAAVADSGSGMAKASEDAGATVDAEPVATVAQDAVTSATDAMPIADAVTDAIVWCGEGYHRIVVESSPDVIWCAPLDPATRPKTIAPCGSGRPYGYHEPTGTYWCVGYAGVDARSS